MLRLKLCLLTLLIHPAFAAPVNDDDLEKCKKDLTPGSNIIQATFGGETKNRQGHHSSSASISEARSANALPMPPFGVAFPKQALKPLRLSEADFLDQLETLASTYTYGRQTVQRAAGYVASHLDSSSGQATVEKIAIDKGFRFYAMQLDIRELQTVLRTGTIERKAPHFLWELQPLTLAQIGKLIGGLRPNPQWGLSQQHDEQKIYLLFGPGIAKSSARILKKKDPKGTMASENVTPVEFDPLLQLTERLNQPDAKWEAAFDLARVAEGPIALWDLVGIVAGNHVDQVREYFVQRFGASVEEANSRIVAGYQIPNLIGPMNIRTPYVVHDILSAYDVYAVTDPLSPAAFVSSGMQSSIESLDFTNHPELMLSSFWLNLVGSRLRVTLGNGTEFEGELSSYAYLVGNYLKLTPEEVKSQGAALELVIRNNDEEKHLFIDPIDKTAARNARAIKVIRYKPNIVSGNKIGIARSILNESSTNDWFIRLVTGDTEKFYRPLVIDSLPH